MSANPYETPRLLAEYLLLHYGSAEEVLGGKIGPAEAAGFPVRLVRELLAPVGPDATALDVGCAVGASSFELARTCASVLGIDYSHAFIAAATHLRDLGTHPYEKAVEGTLTEPAVATVPPGIERHRLTFEQGDACNLDAHPNSKIQNRKFSVVLAANLLCRLPDPAAFLARLSDLVSPGGQLLLTTPFSWLEEYTPRDRWLGGTPATGRGFDALRARLEPHFTLEHRADIPFLIREHARKFQYGIADGTRWRRR